MKRPPGATLAGSEVTAVSPVERIENLALGGGGAGKYINWELAKEGRSAMVIERALVGGSCPNIACLLLPEAPFGRDDGTWS